jgi:hypothetical protein
MNHVVAEISEEQTCERGGRQASENPEEKSVKHDGERDADDWRHDQPAGILRIIVVHAVNQKVQFLSPSAPGFIMENAPVHNVFDQRPDEEAEREQPGGSPDRQPTLSDRQIEHVADRRHVDHQRSHRVHVREELHEVALEHADRLVLVGDVTLRHKLYLA